MRHGALFATVAGGIALAAGAVYVLSIVLDPCSNTTMQTTLSPDKIYKAVLFERDCGATTGFSSQVSVLSVDSKLPNDGGNIFVADLKGKGPRGAWGGPDVHLGWLGNRQLEVRYDHSARTFKREPKSHGVKIHYVITQ